MDGKLHIKITILMLLIAKEKPFDRVKNLKTALFN